MNKRKAYLIGFPGTFVLGLLLVVFNLTTVHSQELMSDKAISKLLGECRTSQKTWANSLLNGSYRSRGLTSAYVRDNADECGILAPVVETLQGRQAIKNSELATAKAEIKRLTEAQLDLQIALAQREKTLANETTKALETINSLRGRVAVLKSKAGNSAENSDDDRTSASISQSAAQRAELEATLQEQRNVIAGLRQERADLLTRMSQNNSASTGGDDQISQFKNRIVALQTANDDKSAEIQAVGKERDMARNELNDALTRGDELKGELLKLSKKDDNNEILLELEDVRRSKLIVELELKASKSEQAYLKRVEDEARGALEAAVGHNMALRTQVSTLQSQLTQKQAPSKNTVTTKVVQTVTDGLDVELTKRLMQALDKSSNDVKLLSGRAVLGNRVLFEKGSADLSDAGRTVVAKLAKAISATMAGQENWLIQVDGHTDIDPISSDKYPSNWYLAAGRAIAVVEALVNSGVSPKNVSATAFAEFQPRDKRESDAAKAVNRRIELRLSAYLGK